MKKNIKNVLNVAVTASVHSQFIESIKGHTVFTCMVCYSIHYMGAEYCNEHICLSVCLLAYLNHCAKPRGLVVCLCRMNEVTLCQGRLVTNWGG